MADEQSITYGDKSPGFDIECTVAIDALPIDLQRKTSEQFNEFIFQFLEAKFDLGKETVCRIVRFPRCNDPKSEEAKETEKEEFAVRCLVSFCSRVHKNRVISRKNRLEPPTTVDSITEAPEEFSGEVEFKIASAVAAPEDLEIMADKCNSNLSDDTATAAVSGNPSAAVAVVSHSTRNTCMLSGQRDAVVGDDDDDASKTAVIKDGKTESKGQAESAEENVEQVVRAVVESIKISTARSLGEDVDPEDASKGEKFFAERKMAMAEFYRGLPVDWNGAPEFQWRLLRDDSDRRVVIFENVLPADIYNPWFYSSILRSKRVIMEFPRSAGKIDTNFGNLYGRVEAYFQSDHPIAYCAVNSLIHIRTGAHRLKIYLPQTKWVRRYKDILESRLGRLREPMESMRYLALKPVGDDITEEQIREAFKNYPIESVRFEKDQLEKRLAILLFPTAREAVAAHSNNDFVYFGSANVPNDYVKVYYPNVDFHGWDKLAVPTEETDCYCFLTYKEFLAITQTKKVEQEQTKLSKASAVMETKQARTDSVKEAQERKRLAETEHEVAENADGGSKSVGNPKTPEDLDVKLSGCESIKPAEKNAPTTKNLHARPTFPRKSGKSVGSMKRADDDDNGGGSRRRRRGGRYRKRRYSRTGLSSSSSFRNISPFAAPPPPIAGRYGGGYRVEPWRRPLQPAPFAYGPAYDSYGYLEARRRKPPPSKLPIMDVAIADATAPPPRPLNELSILERKKELDLQEHILRQQKVIDDLAKKLSTQSSAPAAPPGYGMRNPEQRDPYTAMQQLPSASSSSLVTTTTSKMPAWVTPSIYSQSQAGSNETYEAWR